MARAEIRTYDGDGSDLAQLTQRTWKSRYAGRMWFPLWDERYFRWRLLGDGTGARDFLVAAYEGSSLAGVFMAEPFDFRIGDTIQKATMASYLSVDPEARTPGLGLRLVAELRRRHLEREMAFSLGFVSGDAESLAYRFWSSYARVNANDFHFLETVRFWGVAFDPRAVAAAGAHAIERVGSYVSGLNPVARLGLKIAEGIRDYAPGDLSACVALVEEQCAESDLGVLWSRQRLETQLGDPESSRTLVLEEGGRVRGFINFYPIDWMCGAIVRAAVIDWMGGRLSLRQSRALLKAAGRRIRDEGLQMAILMGSRVFPVSALIAAGYTPIPTPTHLIYMFPGPDIRIPPPRAYHLFLT